MIKTNRLATICFVLLGTAFVKPVFAANMPDPAFNPNYIISDYEITDYNTMTLDQIQKFLESHNSALSTFVCADKENRNWTAAQAIYNISQDNKINPRFLLVLLQKEQGLVEDNTPKTSQLDWATGYGCPDGDKCNERFRGFWRQVNSASLQFLDYLENPQYYTYKKGETYTFSNPYSTTVKGVVTVTPVNQATAALYNYTPHVYNGNYNFWKLWRRYFTKTYPSGSLLKAEGEEGIWLLTNGQRHAFLVKGALTSRFDIRKVITVPKSELVNYEIGTPIKYPQYSIVKSPTEQLFLLIDDRKRGFKDKTVFKKLGYNPEEVLTASWEDLASYKDGPMITADEAYPTGALLQDKKTGAVFWIEAKTKAPVPDAIFLKTKFKNKKIIKARSTDLDKYTTINPIKFNDGELIKIDVGFTVYVVENGALRPIASTQAFKDMGYKEENIIKISQKLFSTYPLGLPIGQ